MRGWIISSRQGCLETWTVKHGGHETSVESLHVEPGEEDRLRRRLPAESKTIDGFAGLPIIRTKQVAGSATSVVQLVALDE